ncbi:MAG: zinc ribbon domain-containing protein [Methanomassiliicoccus sp.]|nr:zinc ribbon domain-containing protein [Methanomassiliicoccus sp.]
MVFCRNCGKQHSGGARFCTACGSRMLKDLHEHDVLKRPQPKRNRVENTYASPSDAIELESIAVTSNNVPTACHRCGLSLPDNQREVNERARKADLSNVKAVLVMFLIPMVGMGMVFFSIGKLQLTSMVFSQAMFYLFLIGVFLSACPFLLLALKGKRLFKNTEGTSYYCSRCLKIIREDQRDILNNRDLPAILAPGQSKHFENDVKQNHKGTVLLMIGLIIPGLIFGWLYGAYVKGFSFQANLEATLFSMAFVAGILTFVLSRFVTPRSIDIAPSGVVVESKRGRRKTIHFDKITWLNVIMDIQQLKDHPNDTGTIYVGRRGIIQMSYRIKREIALEVRNAYRAYRGVYPPNGYDAISGPQARR